MQRTSPGAGKLRTATARPCASRFAFQPLWAAPSEPRQQCGTSQLKQDPIVVQCCPVDARTWARSPVEKQIKNPFPLATCICGTSCCSGTSFYPLAQVTLPWRRWKQIPDAVTTIEGGKNIYIYNWIWKHEILQGSGYWGEESNSNYCLYHSRCRFIYARLISILSSGGGAIIASFSWVDEAPLRLMLQGLVET